MPLAALTGLVLLAASGCGGFSVPPTDGTGETTVSVPFMTGTPIGTIAAPTPIDTASAGPEVPVVEGGLPCSASSDGLDAALIADLGLANGAQVPPGTKYRETWRVRNTGHCTWPEGTELAFVSGDQIPGTQRAPVSQIGPGRDVDISIELTTPVQSARYASYWRLQSPGGQLFGAVIYAEIEVSSNAVAPVLIPDTGFSPSATPWGIAPPTTDATPTASVLEPAQLATPLPSSVPAADNEAGCGAPASLFEPVIQRARELGVELPCTTPANVAGGAATTEQGILQAFWQEIDPSDPSVRLRSFVLVREATQTIYVLQRKNATTDQIEARAYEDTWPSGVPEQPKTCTPMVASSGYTVPSGDIGKLWCERSLWNSIGWPVAEAERVTLITQGDRNKLLVGIVSQTDGIYLLAIDLDARAAAIYQAP